jgi:hypothetical protein
MKDFDTNDLFDTVNSNEFPHPEYRYFYFRNNHPYEWFRLPPKPTIWQKIKNFIIKLFKLKHTKYWIFDQGPTRTASYEVVTDTRKLVFKEWKLK